MKMHILGDSLVQTRMARTGKFYCGWADPLRLFFDDTVEMLNYALGGRSSRSFLNEGRFYDNGLFTKDMPPYGVGPAFSQISAGDYVLIAFMCNDDDSSSCAYRVNKHVFLGEPDENGIYPTVVPTEDMLRPTKGWEKGYKEELEAEGYAPENIKTIMDTTEELIGLAGEMFHPFDSGATYKGYHKFYIDKVREKGAIPILVITGAKNSFTDGKIKPNPGYHGGADAFHDFPLTEALRQLGKEENVPIVDLFALEKPLYEELGEEKVAYLHNMSVEPEEEDNNKDPSGPPVSAIDWAVDFDARMQSKNYKTLDGVHKNHFGAFLQAAEIADSLYTQGVLKAYIRKVPSDFPGMPEAIIPEKELLASKFSYIQPFAGKAEEL